MVPLQEQGKIQFDIFISESEVCLYYLAHNVCLILWTETELHHKLPD